MAADDRERLAARLQAHEDGAWVREAAAAYAEDVRTRTFPGPEHVV
mgnify:CR=1 FL=1